MIKSSGGLTLRDVATEAKVSVKTVSRVLNDEPYVTEETREKVTAAVKKLNFRPNASARQLKLKASPSFLIGLLYDNPSAAYIGRLLIGTLDRCNDFGYRLAIECLPSKREHPQLTRRPDLLTRADLDGVILTPPLSDDLDLIMALEDAGHPIVRVVPFLEPERTPSVTMDDVTAAFDLTTHLIERGHRRIAHISGPDNHGSSAARLTGFRKAMQQAGLIIADGFEQPGNYTFRSGIEAAQELLPRLDRPTAIFVANDEMAAAVLFEAQKFGLAVPEDLSVVGFDDLPLARILEPNITTVRQPLEEMAHAAAGLLIRMKEGRATYQELRLTVSYKLHLRGSSGYAP